ncbi:MAG: N-acetyl-gamma-glutamyl-phosphate reductase [Deltaproteobacteria bacterium]|nr:N-acetyl-gamma-glutamyl-phosphate reductase [Deltaproteobacteria bacterium]
MLRTLIFGVTGYTGIELIRILSDHPKVRIVGGSSRTWVNQKASEVFTYISRKKDFALVELERLLDKPEADVAFLALPHGDSAIAARRLLDAGIRVIDLSADFRLKDLSTYESWYGPHKDPELLGRAVYGLPEIHREHIRKADLVANPGCYPTTVILGIAPVLNTPEVDTSCPVVDSKSGISGAGRGAKLNSSFCEAGEGFKPYGVTGHRHIPEMEQELSFLAGRTVTVRFTPHLIPVSRGMVSTIYLKTETGFDAEMLRQIYEQFYKDEPFVRILPKGVFPDTARVRGSNQAHISVEIDNRTNHAIIMVAIDNLVKGASGAAVQNMNIMFDLEETSALTGLPLFP